MNRLSISIVGLFLIWIAVSIWTPNGEEGARPKGAREEVVFWHFWGGADRDVVDEVVARFNDSQDRYLVRAIAMPGNNLDVKLFLAITGGDPPDLVNQDDPIVADWASRDALLPLDQVASQSELEQLKEWLFPAAYRLGEYDGQLYALCNGLDIRALFYNRTMLNDFGLPVPQTLDDLELIAETISPPDSPNERHVGYLPDSRRLWAWGYVFGGRFIDERTGRATLEDERIVSALDWMASFSRRYGVDYVTAFRAGDQTLPGKDFRLLPWEDDSLYGRYAVLMDGQWRCRDIDDFNRARRESGLTAPDFGVCPLPPPPAGLNDAGWVNGNFFVIPKGAHSPDGAWAFMKFWSGFSGNEQIAAETCQQGGWIPVSQNVVDRPSFQQYLDEHPLFRQFVELASSEHQHPVPIVRGASFLNREVKDVGERAINEPNLTASELLHRAQQRVAEHLERIDE